MLLYCRLWVAFGFVGLLVGCTSSSISNTPRTSTEQLLVANAVDQALDKVNFTPFAGYNVYLQDKYVDCVDKNYVIASTRHRLFNAGAHLVDAADKADVILELRSGAVGTTSAVSFVGTPEIALPGMLTIPEVRFIERKRQQGTAKLGVVAFDAKTNEVLGSGGTSLARADDSNWFVAGIGPYQNGSVLKEVHDSTTGPTAKQKPQVPIAVAFKSPAAPVTPGTLEPSATQYAAGAQPPSEVSPVSHDATFDPPWTKSR